MFKDKESFKRTFRERLESFYGKSLGESTPFERYSTLANMVREYVGSDWIETNRNYKRLGAKQVYYISMEFLIGRLLRAYLIHLGIYDLCKEGLDDLGISLKDLEEEERDPGLGSGGLGRLAADFLDSMASLGFPGHGYGIRYRNGLFEQKIVDGYQVEVPDYWLQEGYDWEVRRFDRSVEVHFGGEVKMTKLGERLIFRHEGYEAVLAVPYYVPIVGYRNKVVNTLRLWSAESIFKEFNIHALSERDYARMMDYKRATEAISGFLYPDDSNLSGKILRIKQQYFLVSASLQDIINSFKRSNKDLRHLPDQVAIHINDTHPTLAIPELMRILMDEEGFGWEEAWEITVRTFSYTNHTILSEALEKWPIDMIKRLLPRIYMIIEEINERFCRDLWNRHPGDWDRIHQMAVVADGQVKMAHLAIVGSHSVNGVSEIHTDILKKKVMNLFYQEMPSKFNSKTNGISHRRWLLSANPGLSGLIKERIGCDWINRPDELTRLKEFSTDRSFLEELQKVKQKNKEALARYISERYRIIIDPSSLFDVHIKRIHAYKRQLLNILHIFYRYLLLKENPNLNLLPRTFIFAGKAAPNYYYAKAVIKLIHSVAEKINQDQSIGDRLKVVFMENYGVSLAEKIIPAADVSEQISTASQEASGTGNMKFMMNGAITVGTLDGANVEILEAVGEENFFLFGLKAEEVLEYYAKGGYQVRDLYRRDDRIPMILEPLVSGYFHSGYEEFHALYHSLITDNDPFFVLKDFDSYAAAHDRLEKAYLDRNRWNQMSLIQIAESGRFSSDRTIDQYADEIWEVGRIGELKKN